MILGEQRIRRMKEYIREKRRQEKEEGPEATLNTERFDEKKMTTDLDTLEKTRKEDE